MFNRFFAFGCSYTNYLWPTWADIIARDLGIEYHNYGRAGFGNVAIECEILRADIEHKLTKNDLVIIMWSHWNREDRYIAGEWKPRGNIFTNDFYDRPFIKKYWDFDNDIIKNSTSIIVINKAYQGIISFQSSIMPPGDFESKKYHKDKNSNDLFRFYSPYLPKAVFTYNDPYYFDGHPSIESYLGYVEKEIYPSLGFTLKDSTRKIFQDLHTMIKNIDEDTKIKNKHKTVSNLLDNANWKT